MEAKLSVLDRAATGPDGFIGRHQQRGRSFLVPYLPYRWRHTARQGWKRRHFLSMAAGGRYGDCGHTVSL